MSFILRMYQFTVAIPTILFCAYISDASPATVNKVRIIFSSSYIFIFSSSDLSDMLFSLSDI